MSGRYVDMCGAHSVTAYSSAGSGSACSKTVADYPTPLVLEYAGAGLFAIRHESAPNVYLRADGTGITQYTPAGAGAVNLQFGVGTRELFHVVPQSDGTVGFETVLWPNVYLRLDQSRVNLQFGCGPQERFRIRNPVTFRIVSTMWWRYVALVGDGVDHFVAGGLRLILVPSSYGLSDPYTRFTFVDLSNGVVAFKSVSFANIFIRLDLTKVNLQYEVGIGPYENFRILPVV
eukprot:m51a1_g8327 hypothetical protein (232) ;mRNA; f:157422-158656